MNVNRKQRVIGKRIGERTTGIKQSLFLFRYRSVTIILVLLSFITLGIFYSNTADAEINLEQLWDEGEYWVPRTYDEHLSNYSGWEGARRAVDFYWSPTQTGNFPATAISGDPNRYDAAAETGRGKHVLAPHGGVAQLSIYKFSTGDCGQITAQPQIKIISGSQVTYFIHLETSDPVSINDSVTVYNKRYWFMSSTIPFQN